MSNFAYIPTDPGEIEHVLDLLRQDLDPENQRVIRQAEMRGYDIAPRLRDALIEAIAPHVPEWERSDWSDFAHLTANTRYGDWIRAAAVAICNLRYLQEVSDRRVEHGTDLEDINFDWLPEWERLRTALIEVALSMTYAELIDEEKRRKRAEEHAAALGEAAAKAKPLIERQGKNTMLPKTAFYIRMIESNPTMGNSGIANHVFDTAPASNDGESHFYWNGKHELIDRSSGKPISVKQMTQQIQKARSEHVNGRKHKAKKKVR